MEIKDMFEKRWDECFEGIKESNTKKFGELAPMVSQGFLEFKPLFELFYSQAVEDYKEHLKSDTDRVDLIDSKIKF